MSNLHLRSIVVVVFPSQDNHPGFFQAFVRQEGFFQSPMCFILIFKL